MAEGQQIGPIAAGTTLYAQVREILEAARSTVARTVNSEMVRAYWLIGHLSAQLQTEFGRGFAVANLKYMRLFYQTYPHLLESEIRHAVRDESGIVGSLPTIGSLNPALSWTHYRLLTKVESSYARAFYEVETARNGWSSRELERQVASLLFERLAASRDKAGLLALATHGQEVARPIDAIKDPLILEFLGLPESARLVESDLEAALIANLQTFLLELGRGFAFLARQQRLTLDGDHFYVDLVFYHTLLKCYVLIDLKVGKLTHGDLGQMQLYVNYFDRERRIVGGGGDGPTIGLILCTDKNDTVVRYTLGEEDRQIFASRYRLYLPSEEELAAEIARELRQVRPMRDAV